MSPQTLAFLIRTIQLAEPGSASVGIAARAIWEALTPDLCVELLGSAATDRVGTPRERPGDKRANDTVDGPAMFRLMELGLLFENARRGDRLLTPVGQVVSDWAEQHHTAPAPDGCNGAGAEDSREP